MENFRNYIIIMGNGDEYPNKYDMPSMFVIYATVNVIIMLQLVLNYA